MPTNGFNSARCDRSDQLLRLLSGRFFSRVWEKEWKVWRSAYSCDYGAKEFAEALDSAHRILVPPLIKMYREGAEVPFEEYSDLIVDRKCADYRQVSSRKVMDKCTSGDTLIVNSLDACDAKIKAMADRLNSIFEQRVQVNAYYSSAAVPGFGVHYDTHNIFVVQAKGSKKWLLGSEPMVMPLPSMPSSAEMPPSRTELTELVLREGDVLYIPRGLWHEAVSEDGGSLHLSFGVHCVTYRDYLLYLVDEMSDVEQVREIIMGNHSSRPMRFDESTVALADEIARRLRSPKRFEEFMRSVQRSREGESVPFDL
jgi:ribosomal protein L16 Arg81 hydroxylase